MNWGQEIRKRIWSIWTITTKNICRSMCNCRPNGEFRKSTLFSGLLPSVCLSYCCINHKSPLNRDRPFFLSSIAIEMRLEIVLFLVVGFIMANIYTDGKYLKRLLSYKKYYQMAGVAFGGMVLYWLLKKNPRGAHEMIRTSNEYLKHLPIDSNAAGIISPILDFTTKQEMVHNGGGGGYGHGTNSLYNIFARDPMAPPTRQAEMKLMNSGGMANGVKKTKRSVSETKKKFVASRQNWKCGDCQQQLSAWFEVDHKVRLEYGGSNHIDNLVALCRECHGKKTTIENL